MKPRFALINALFVTALVTTGCPAKGTAPGFVVKPASTGRGTSKPAPVQTTKPDQPAPLPPGTPEGPTPQTPPTNTPTIPSDTITNTSSFLGGSVFAPASIISNNGGAIISNNGGAIISNNGGAIISNNGGAIISNNGGAIISNGAGSYHVLDASGPEGVLKNAFLYLTDRDERFFRNAKTSAVFTATTNTSGAYRFDHADGDGFPFDKDVIVNALLNGNLRMTGYLVPTDGENTMKLNLATTLAAEYLRADAYRNGKTLKSYNRDLFYQTATLTQQAITSGDIAAITKAKNHDGALVTVGTFDLRIDHVFNLRNQYVIAISAVDKAKTAIKKISDNWKTLLGVRPTAVTTFAGNGEFPKVNPAFNYPADPDADPIGVGGITGDWRLDPAHKSAAELPVGFAYDVAVAKRGDVFICGYSEAAASGFIRWIKQDGTVSSVWLPTYYVYQPAAVCVENEPTDNPDAPGTLLIADNATNQVIRVPIIDAPYPALGYEYNSMQIVAGEDNPTYSENFDPDAPAYVDCKRDPVTHAAILAPDPVYGDMVKQAENNELQTDVAAKSRWRLSDEGNRTYAIGNVFGGTRVDGNADHAVGTEVPNASRYARLNRPQDVIVDECKNIYIADKANHRVRMIPSGLDKNGSPIADQNYYGYRHPIDDGDGIIDSYGGPEMMKPGRIYTIVGNPEWDGTPTGGGAHNKTTDVGGYWFGDFGGDAAGTGAAQTAKLDQPYSLAFDVASATLYICDHDNQRIRAVKRATGAISTVVGTPPGAQRGSLDRDFPPANLSDGNTGFDGGAALAGQLSFPRGITVDAKGRLYIADGVSGRIRLADIGPGGTGKITTIAGRKHDPNDPTPTDNVTDGDALLWVDLYDTDGLAIDNDNNVLLADTRHHRVRKLWRQWD